MKLNFLQNKKEENMNPKEILSSGNNNKDPCGNFTDNFTKVFLSELEDIRKFHKKTQKEDFIEKIDKEIKRIKGKQKIQEEEKEPIESKKNNDEDRCGSYSVLPSAQAGLMGIALSGGGIRSATFNLGLLQALNHHEILEKVDYLSTVSGGGYIGTCMITLLNSPTGSVGLKKDNFPLGRSKIEGSEEPTLEKEPVRRLRYFSNYLTAESGLFAKYLRPAMVFMRGVLLNFFLIFPYIIAMSLLLALIFNIKILAPSLKNNHYFFDFVEFSDALKTSNKEYHNAMGDLRKYAVERTAGLNFDTDQERIEWVRGFGETDKTFINLHNKTEKAKENLKKEWRSIWIIPFWCFVILILLTLLFIICLSLVSEKRSDKLNKCRNMLMYGCTGLFTFAVGLVVLQLYGVLIVYWKSWEISLWIVSVALLSFIGPRLLRGGSRNDGPVKKGLIKITIAFALLLLGPLFILYLMGGIIANISIGNGYPIISIIGGIIVLFIISSRFINLNEISLHKYYRDCLTRAYMMQYDDNAQDIYHEDNLKFSDLNPEKSPYFIVNTTLNLKKIMPRKKEQKKDPEVFRTGESFIFSKNWCGSAKTGYLPTKCHENEDPHINVGTAMAISGAAANIGMAHKNIFVLRFLMGLLNIRLGYWALRRPGDYPKSLMSRIIKGSPGSFQAFQEWFGLYNLNWRYINLSDGGHFDNIGVYELLRRRCKYIIVGDAEADKDMKFEAISYIIRLARIDFGIEIKIDTSDIKPDSLSRFSSSHCAVGRIEYPEGDFGYLLYCKASLTGDEPEHLHEYKIKHPQFPHQTTADQWFDEQQFEAYRELGYHIGREALSPLKTAIEADKEEQFNLLKDFWYPGSQTVENQFTRHAVELNKIVLEIKNDDHLKFMDSQIYPEWESLMQNIKQPPSPDHLWLPPGENEIRKGFYLCNLMMQLMENVYTDLNLQSDYAHPDNRGWMNLFQHWSFSGMFRVTWSISASTFGARFQNFCKKHFKLDLGELIIKDYKDKNFESAISKELNPYEQKIVENYLKNLDKARSQTIYLFKLEVKDPINSINCKTFHFGFALSDKHNVLTFFRIQDHLQMMGLGRKALKKLMSEYEVKKYSTLYASEFEKIYSNSDAVTLAEINQKSFEKMASDLGLIKKTNGIT
jgi:hypothetical protein